MTARITIKRKCLCGAAMTVASRPPAAAMRLAGLFDELHVGPGHGVAPFVEAVRPRHAAAVAALRIPDTVPALLAEAGQETP